MSTRAPSSRRHATAALLLAGAMPLAAPAAPPVPVQLQYSADVGGNFAGPGVTGYASRRDYVIDTLTGVRVPVRIAGLPERVDLRDFQIDPDGAVLFALDTGAKLGGLYFAAGDVVRFKNGLFLPYFDAVDAGIPEGVRCDGVARAGALVDSPLLLSFDRGFKLGADTIVPADVLIFVDGEYRGRLLDAKALGLPEQLNVDAIESAGTTTDLLVSFDTGGKVGGVTFADHDVLDLDLVGAGGWTKLCALDEFATRWGPANLDGLAAAPNGDGLFKDGFE